MEINDPGTLWASTLSTDGQVASGTITAGGRSSADVVQVDISRESADFTIAAGKTRSEEFSFTLTPTDDTEVTHDETVTFSLTGTGAPGGGGTTLTADSVEVVIADDDLPTGRPCRCLPAPWPRVADYRS